MPIRGTGVSPVDARRANLRAGERSIMQRGYRMLVQEVISTDFKSQHHRFVRFADVELMLDAEISLGEHRCALVVFNADDPDGVGARCRSGDRRSRILREVHPTAVILNILTGGGRADGRPAGAERRAREH